MSKLLKEIEDIVSWISSFGLDESGVELADCYIQKVG